MSTDDIVSTGAEPNWAGVVILMSIILVMTTIRATRSGQPREWILVFALTGLILSTYLWGIHQQRLVASLLGLPAITLIIFHGISSGIGEREAYSKCGWAIGFSALAVVAILIGRGGLAIGASMLAAVMWLSLAKSVMFRRSQEEVQNKWHL